MYETERMDKFKVLKLLSAALFAQLFLTWIAIYMAPSWLEPVSCPDIFQRPHERHKIKIRPNKHIFALYELGENDKTKLINISDFAFINNKRIDCGNDEVTLLILISSGPNNKIKRDAIRKTWADRYEDVKLFFLLGISEDRVIEEAVEKEIRIYADIIQGQFVDAYRNLSYKSTMGLKYVTYHCSQAMYILKVDDDVFVNLPLLLNFLKHDLSPYGAENLLLCNDLSKSVVIRDPNSKWYIPADVIPEPVYPSYCSGWYAIFSSDIAFELYKMTQNLTYLHIDDVLIYGYAARKANITHTDFSYFTLAYRNVEQLFNGTYDHIPIIFGSVNMSPTLIQRMYDYFKNKPIPQSIYKKLGEY